MIKSLTLTSNATYASAKIQNVYLTNASLFRNSYVNYATKLHSIATSNIAQDYCIIYFTLHTLSVISITALLSYYYRTHSDQFFEFLFFYQLACKANPCSKYSITSSDISITVHPLFPYVVCFLIP